MFIRSVNVIQITTSQVAKSTQTVTAADLIAIAENIHFFRLPFGIHTISDSKTTCICAAEATANTPMC